jgi:hypothetical protein
MLTTNHKPHIAKPKTKSKKITFIDKDFIANLTELSHTLPSKPKTSLISADDIAIRRTLIDWLSEIKLKLKLHHLTTILSTMIYDKVIKTFDHKLNAFDHHILMISSLLIAIKYEEIEQMNIDSICKHIAHNRFSKRQILACEMLILKRLNFKIPSIKFADFSHSLLNLLFEQFFIESNVKYKQIIEEFSILIYKLTLFDYDLCNVQELPLFICVIFNSFKLFETEPACHFENFHYQIFKDLGIQEDAIKDIDSKIDVLLKKYIVNKTKSFIIKEFTNFVSTLN